MLRKQTRLELSLERLLLCEQGGGRRRAALALTVEVLQSDESSIDACDLALRRVVRRERDCDGRVVDGVARENIRGECVDIGGMVGWALARNLDGRAIRAIHSAVAVTSAGRVLPSGEAKVRRELRDLRCGRGTS